MVLECMVSPKSHVHPEPAVVAFLEIGSWQVEPSWVLNPVLLCPPEPEGRWTGALGRQRPEGHGHKPRKAGTAHSMRGRRGFLPEQEGDF